MKISKKILEKLLNAIGITLSLDQRTESLKWHWHMFSTNGKQIGLCNNTSDEYICTIGWDKWQAMKDALLKNKYFVVINSNTHDNFVLNPFFEANSLEKLKITIDLLGCNYVQ